MVGHRGFPIRCPQALRPSPSVLCAEVPENHAPARSQGAGKPRGRWVPQAIIAPKYSFGLLLGRPCPLVSSPVRRGEGPGSALGSWVLTATVSQWLA